MPLSFFTLCSPAFFTRLLSYWQEICLYCGKVHLYLKLHESFQMDCFNMGTFRSFMELPLLVSVGQLCLASVLSRCKGSSHYSSRQKPLEGQSRHRICSRITVLGSVLSRSLKENVRGNLKKKSTISPKLFL